MGLRDHVYLITYSSKLTNKQGVLMSRKRCHI